MVSDDGSYLVRLFKQLLNLSESLENSESEDDCHHNETQYSHRENDGSEESFGLKNRIVIVLEVEIKAIDEIRRHVSSLDLTKREDDDEENCI